MRYYCPWLIVAGTLVLAACDQPEHQPDNGGALPHPEITTTQSGGDVGSAETQSNRPAGGEVTKGGIKPAQNERNAASAAEVVIFENEEFNLRVSYPESLERHVGDGEGNNKKAGWNAFADADADGTRLLTLTVPGANDARRAEFRLGANRSTQALTHCEDIPAGATQPPGEEKRRTIDGVPFTTFEVDNVTQESDERIRSYRATYTEACYAIDLIVSVASDQRAGESSSQQAFETLQAALDGVEFTE